MSATTTRATVWLALAVISTAAPALAQTGPDGITSGTRHASLTPLNKSSGPVVYPRPSRVTPAAIPSAPAPAAAQPTPNIKSSTPAPPAPQTQDTQTLSALYNIACGYDAPYRAALAQVRASEAAVSQARAALLPQVGLQADVQGNRLNASAKSPRPIWMPDSPVSGHWENNQSFTRNYAQNDVGISARQVLYNPAGKITLDQSQRQLAVAQIQLAAIRQDLMVRLAQAYFDVLTAQETLRYLRTLKEAVSQQLAMAQRNFQLGNANVTDSREAKARLATTAAREIAAERDLYVKQLALEQLTGKTGLTPRPLAPAASLPSPEPLDIKIWTTRAAYAPPVRQARLALEIAQLEIDKAKTGHRPSLDLMASVAHAQYPSGNPMGSIAAFTGYQATVGTVGIQMTWPLIAGGAVVARERETQALQDKAQAQLDDALRGSIQATRAAYASLQSGLAQVQALQAAQDASRTALQANQLGYKIGARTNIDVLNAQSEDFQTQRDLIHARYDTLTGLLRLKQAAGILTPSDLRQIDNLLTH